MVWIYTESRRRLRCPAREVGTPGISKEPPKPRRPRLQQGHTTKGTVPKDGPPVSNLPRRVEDQTLGRLHRVERVDHLLGGLLHVG